MSAQDPESPPLHLVPEIPVHADAMRFWLMSGIHKVAIDPRRRLGGHSRARELLTRNQPVAHGSPGAWELLASTLDRHTVLGGMTELSAEERNIIMLAYLEGRSNREIAGALGISIGTVRKRIQAALAQLDKYLTQTGTWILAILLLGAGHAVRAATRLGRTALEVRSPDWTHTLASAAAVGAVTAAAIGSTAVSQGPAGPRTVPPPVTAHAAAPPSTLAAFSRGQRPAAAPVSEAPIVAAAESHGNRRNDNAIHNQAGAKQPNHFNGNQGLALGHSKQPPGQSQDQGSPPTAPES